MIKQNGNRQSAIGNRHRFHNRRSHLARVLGLPFFIFCFCSLGCETDPDVDKQKNDRKPNLEEAYNIQSFLSQNGNLRAKLTSPFMLRYAMDTSYLEFPKTLHVNFFDSTGKVESQVDALYGKYFETRNKVYLRDSVVVFNVKGDTLRSPDLWWDQNTKKFYTDKFIRLRTKDKRLYGGKGFEADQDLNRWTIFQPTGVIYVPDSMKVQ
jgi:LPS export ABC transporter protein LptC